MEESLQPAPPPRPPAGSFPSRVDEKGRCRLPKEFEDFLRSLPDSEFFVTSIDGGSVVRVYPMSVWQANVKIMAEFDEDPELAEATSFEADHWGAASNIDSQGRVLIPPELRRKAGVENQKVKVRYYRSAVEIYSEVEGERRLARTPEQRAAAVQALRKKGLQ